LIIVEPAEGRSDMGYSVLRDFASLISRARRVV
jgi:hypothetical protein